MSAIANPAGESKRPRLTIDIESDLHNYILGAAQARGQTIRDFCVDAIQEQLDRDRITIPSTDDLISVIRLLAESHQTSPRNLISRAIEEFSAPSIRFSAPVVDPVETLCDLLKGAKEEVRMLGHTLATLQSEELILVLKDLVDKKVLMRFMVIDPEIMKSGKPAYEFLSQYYATSYLDKICSIATQTLSILGEFVKYAKDRNGLVQVFTVKRVISAGLTIIDPYTQDCRLRVITYLELAPYHLHPVFEINTKHHQGQEAAALFSRHFDWLTADDQSQVRFNSLSL